MNAYIYFVYWLYISLSLFYSFGLSFPCDFILNNVLMSSYFIPYFFQPDSDADADNNDDDDDNDAGDDDAVGTVHTHIHTHAIASRCH